MTTTSILTRIPENTSFLQSTKFTFVFPTLPFLKYFCQAVTLPGVSTNPVTVSSPFVNTYRHGDKLTYDELTVTAIIDEDLRVWEETYNWIKSLTKPNDYSQYVKYYNKKNTPYHDAELTINTNANVPNIRFKFTECHPVLLGSIPFNTTENATKTLTVDITFRYDQYYIDRLN